MNSAPDPENSRPDPAVSHTELKKAVAELERHVAGNGWEQTIRLFALVRTATVIEVDPLAATRLPAETIERAKQNPAHLMSIEQDKIPATNDLESLLGVLSWPDVVDGAAIVAERIVLPPQAQEELPTDEAEALDFLMNHPDRQDIRLAAGVLRSGARWSAVRTRSNDDDALVLEGEELAESLSESLLATFAED